MLVIATFACGPEEKLQTLENQNPADADSPISGAPIEQIKANDSTAPSKSAQAQSAAAPPLENKKIDNPTDKPQTAEVAPLNKAPTPQEETMDWSESIKMFKDLRIPKTIKLENANVTLKVKSAKVANKWLFDRAGYQYFYNSADKGSKMIVVDLDIVSDNKDPSLPEFFIYEISSKNRFISYQGELDINFYKWDSYGSYLGNYSDDGNDFSKQDTVRFTLGRELSESIINESTLLIVAYDGQCREQKYERFENPPISYETNNSCRFIYADNAKQLLEKMRPIAILGKQKLKVVKP